MAPTTQQGHVATTTTDSTGVSPLSVSEGKQAVPTWGNCHERKTLDTEPNGKSLQFQFKCQKIVAPLSKSARKTPGRVPSIEDLCCLC